MPRPLLNVHHKIYIRSQYLLLPASKMAEFIGCHRSTVSKFLRTNKLRPDKKTIENFRINAMLGRSIFTKEMDQILIKNYLSVPQKPLAKQIGVSSTCLRTRMRQLGLEVPDKIIAQRKQKGMFKKGMVSFNKGLKITEFLSPKAIEKLKKTQFKKGHKPKNTLSGNGHIRIRKDSKTGRLYKYIKLKDSNWQLLARVVYEKEKAAIPNNHVIRFIDGNTLNCDIKNLECISMAENGKRTLNEYHNHPKELKTAIKLKNKILKSL